MPSESSRPTRLVRRGGVLRRASSVRAERRTRVVGVVAGHEDGRPSSRRCRPRPAADGSIVISTGLALAREHRRVVPLHAPEVREVEDVVGRADDEGVELLLGHQRPDAIELRVVPRPGHKETRGGAGSPWASCQETTGLRSTPIFSISASITSPGLRYSEAASSLKPATPLTVPVDTTSPAEYPSARVVREDLRDRHRHVAAVRLLPRLAVDAQLHPQVVRIADLVGRHDPGPERAERVDRLAEREHAGAHLAPLDVSRGDVVEDHVAADVVRRLLRAEPLARTSRSRPRARARSRAPRSGAPGRRSARPGRRSRRRSGRRRSTARSRATSRRASTPPRARGSCRPCGRTSSGRSARAA